MLVFPFSLITAAEQAGMKTPDLLAPADEYDANAFPHFAVFCGAQLGRPMSPGAHWENAKVIAAISEEDIRRVTGEDLFELGWIV